MFPVTIRFDENPICSHLNFTLVLHIFVSFFCFKTILRPTLLAVVAVVVVAVAAAVAIAFGIVGAEGVLVRRLLLGPWQIVLAAGGVAPLREYPERQNFKLANNNF